MRAVRPSSKLCTPDGSRVTPAVAVLAEHRRLEVIGVGLDRNGVDADSERTSAIVSSSWLGSTVGCHRAT